MSPRYIVRRERDAPLLFGFGQSEEQTYRLEDRECIDLDFHDAFKAADDLNKQSKEK